MRREKSVEIVKSALIEVSLVQKSDSVFRCEVRSALL